ncbi:MAG: DUF2384 domain-containing protein [Bacteroidota bacterium]|nr:DUF2384 domain-containing protein [Bacteroidota bacterium]
MAVIANTREALVKRKFKNLKLNNLHAVVSLARKRLNTKIFYDFAETIQMTEKRLAAIIHLSTRTISNYKEQKKTLEPLYSEHLLKLILLFEKGEELFGNIDEFNYWLKKPFWNSKEIPMDWIVTPGGVDLLVEEMESLAQGYTV